VFSNSKLKRIFTFASIVISTCTDYADLTITCKSYIIECSNNLRAALPKRKSAWLAADRVQMETAVPPVIGKEKDYDDY